MDKGSTLGWMLAGAGVWIIVRAAVSVAREGWNDPTVRVSFCSSLWMAALLLLARSLFHTGTNPAPREFAEIAPETQQAAATAPCEP
jgi:hypothetical protein